VSKVANFAVDLPDANIAIQVSGTFGSRQEEAQRVGRILRPKAEGTETVFYTLVSTDTSEVRFADNRQLFMTEQGYSYTIVDAQSDFSHLDWSDSEDEMVVIDGE
jgi:DNA excision repair protein ERCC-3